MKNLIFKLIWMSFCVPGLAIAQSAVPVWIDGRVSMAAPTYDAHRQNNSTYVETRLLTNPGHATAGDPRPYEPQGFSQFRGGQIGGYDYRRSLPSEAWRFSIYGQRPYTTGDALNAHRRYDPRVTTSQTPWIDSIFPLTQAYRPPAPISPPPPLPSQSVSARPLDRSFPPRPTSSVVSAPVPAPASAPAPAIGGASLPSVPSGYGVPRSVQTKLAGGEILKFQIVPAIVVGSRLLARPKAYGQLVTGVEMDPSSRERPALRGPEGEELYAARLVFAPEESLSNPIESELSILLTLKDFERLSQEFRDYRVLIAFYGS